MVIIRNCEVDTLFFFLFSLCFPALSYFQSSFSNFFLCLLLLLPIKVFLTVRRPPSGIESSLQTVLFGSSAPSQLGVVECRLCVQQFRPPDQSCWLVSVQTSALGCDVQRLQSWLWRLALVDTGCPLPLSALFLFKICFYLYACFACLRTLYVWCLWSEEGVGYLELGAGNLGSLWEICTILHILHLNF